jgi:hypothetical protein
VESAVDDGDAERFAAIWVFQEFDARLGVSKVYFGIFEQILEDFTQDFIGEDHQRRLQRPLGLGAWCNGTSCRSSGRLGSTSAIV